MNEARTLLQLRDELKQELCDHLLPFWMNKVVDHRHGGFHGRLLNDTTVIPQAPRSAILYSRILWTFSAAHRLLGDTAYLEIADRAYRYIEDYFWDPLHGGVYWMVDHMGLPLDTKKHTYAQAFAIYGLSEYYRTVTDETALKRAEKIYRLLENYSLQPGTNGYYEAFSREWKPLRDVRLSEKDDAEQHSMNTHLHLLEAYTNLLRAWPDEDPRHSLTLLNELFLGPLYNKNNKHFFTFFDENWFPRSNVYSFGHDIEATWLILDAARAIGDARLIERTREVSLTVARRALRDGIDRERGGLYYSGFSGKILDSDKHWWSQAEAIVGFVNAYRESKDPAFVQAASGIWEFTKQYIIDHEYGEWFFRVTREGEPYRHEDKAGPWKCPYHTVRAALELIERVDDKETVGEVK
jgi:cellobiose epimerase